MRLSRRDVLTGAALAAGAGPAAAAMFFLPSQLGPTLLIVDAGTLDDQRYWETRHRGYVLDTQMPPDCSETDFVLLTSRLLLAQRVIAVLGEADHALLLKALRFNGATIALDAGFDDPAAQADPHFAKVRDLLLSVGPVAGQGLRALVAEARRD